MFAIIPLCNVSLFPLLNVLESSTFTGYGSDGSTIAFSTSGDVTWLELPVFVYGDRLIVEYGSASSSSGMLSACATNVTGGETMGSGAVSSNLAFNSVASQTMDGDSGNVAVLSIDCIGIVLVPMFASFDDPNEYECTSCCCCWLFNVLMRWAIELRIGLIGADFWLDNCDAAVFCVKMAFAVSTRLPINSLASRLRCWRISSADVSGRTGLGGFNGFGTLCCGG